MQVRFRPLTTWPGERSKRREGDRFDSTWTSTLQLLERELEKIGAREVVIEIAVDENAIRIDGWPRHDARPRDPGVVVSFDSKHGALRYCTDRFYDWRANLRAIALGLEALRKVDRYGITNRGEQYTGWKQLGAGDPIELGSAPRFESADAAARFLGEAAGWHTPPDPMAPSVVEAAYKAAAKAHHPDAGGDHDTFVRLQAARDLLVGVS